MAETMIERINSLRGMTVGQLREKYRDVFGEESRSGNKDWLWKRIAWRIQELEYGGLSERARKRASELANEADIRMRVPKNAFNGHPGEARKNNSENTFALSQGNRRYPTPGTMLSRKYKGRIYGVRALENGFEYDGRIFRSLSAVARDITGSHWNGNLFFNISGNGGQKA
jgi:hypothetical protein